MGEIAHIVSASQDGPRGRSALTAQERDQHQNLILLCPDHHTVVDKQPNAYTVEQLREMKREHEAWVEARLGRGRPRFGAATLPPPPALLVGRERHLTALRDELTSDPSRRSPAVVRGLPGVGKTTLLAAAVHDEELLRSFPDGSIWIPCGPRATPLALVTELATPLGIPALGSAAGLGDAAACLRAALADRRALLVVDDAWEVEVVAPIVSAVGPACRIAVSTRDLPMANELSLGREPLALPVLGVPDAVDLMRHLCPAVVASHPGQVKDLVERLECLPLALHVAGRLLRTEASYGWGVAELLDELGDPDSLLSERAPADRHDPDTGVIPTVDAILRRSTDRLDTSTRRLFSWLGALAAKPATVTLEELIVLWDVANPRPTLRVLVDRGLVEVVGEGQYQVHALVMAHARRLAAGTG